MRPESGALMAGSYPIRRPVVKSRAIPAGMFRQEYQVVSPTRVCSLCFVGDETCTHAARPKSAPNKKGASAAGNELYAREGINVHCVGNILSGCRCEGTRTGRVLAAVRDAFGTRPSPVEDDTRIPTNRTQPNGRFSSAASLSNDPSLNAFFGR